jgi:hypothetical protein
MKEQKTSTKRHLKELILEYAVEIESFFNVTERIRERISNNKKSFLLPSEIDPKEKYLYILPHEACLSYMKGFFLR